MNLNWKFRSLVILGLLQGLALATPSTCHAQGINVVMDGRTIVFADSPPFEQNGSVLVPLRGVFEQLGAGVNYNAATHTIEATKGQTDVILRLGEDNAYINGQAQPLLQPPLVVHGSTFVPLRFVAQSFGAKVNWIAATQTVEIQTTDNVNTETTNPVMTPDTGDNTVPNAADTSDDANDGNNMDAGAGPVRLARFSDVEGNVTWRPTSDTDWSPASSNIPLREGAQIWSNNDGRAELQFDDGSWMRLGQNAVATIQTLYSDSRGEFTLIKLSQGVASLSLRNSDSTYQVDTTLVSVKSAGSATFRINSNNGVEVAVRDGSVDVAGARGNEHLLSGSDLQLTNADAQYTVGGLPTRDSWDRWCDTRNDTCANPDSNIPPNIGLVAGDLDNYGTWHQDGRYGAVWTPQETDPNWRPYSTGRWVWVSPFGWTWVASEPWGWAPYHYGTWIQESYGWSWVPGPEQQYWSPAVVYFSKYQGDVCWAPLAPTEVQYPSANSVAQSSHEWSASFSIGGCAVYYAKNSNVCAPRVWRNRDLNNHSDAANVNNVYNNTTIVNVTKNVFVANVTFVPTNGRGGATSTSAVTFGHAGGYRAINDAEGLAFSQGKTFGAPVAGSQPMGGPGDASPTRASLTPSRIFTPAPVQITSIVKRPVFQAPLPPTVQAALPPRAFNPPPPPKSVTSIPVAPTVPNRPHRPLPPSPTSQPAVITPDKSTPAMPDATVTPTRPRRPVTEPTYPLPNGNTGLGSPNAPPATPPATTTPTWPHPRTNPSTPAAPDTATSSAPNSNPPAAPVIITPPVTPPRPHPPAVPPAPFAPNSNPPAVPTGTKPAQPTAPPQGGSTPTAGPGTSALPSVKGLSPGFGKAGALVTISGTNLTGITGVMFNGMSSPFTVKNSTTITTTVPVGATVGPIKVKTQAGKLITVGNFIAIQ